MSNDTEERRTASILDKTDWRKSIQKYVDQCIMSINTVYYPNAVERLISAIYGHFPNWDAKGIIDKKRKELKEEYRKAILKHIENHLEFWVHPGKRLTLEPDIINSYYTDLFNFVFNELSERRMLLWGAIESQAISYDELRKHIR